MPNSIIPNNNIDQKVAKTITRIILEEIYADGIIEAYERAILKKILIKVGIQRNIFQKMHQEVSLEAKKKSLKPSTNNQLNFLQKVSQRVSESANSKIAKDITDLLANEFQLESPNTHKSRLNIETDKSSHNYSHKTVNEKIIPSDNNINNLNKTVKVQDQKMKNTTVSSSIIPLKNTQVKKVLHNKKKNVADSKGNLQKSSTTYGLACYLLGNGSLSWMLVFALIPILMNLNVQELYNQYRYFSTNTTKVSGEVIGSVYARNALLGSEVREVHYHYIKDGKNFTGYSYTLDMFLSPGFKGTVIVNNSNPKMSQLIHGSYYEYDIIIFVPILALILFLGLAIYGSYNSDKTPASELQGLDQDLNSILSHFFIRRLSIVIASILFCSFFSIGDVLFNTLMPIINTVGLVVGIIAILIYIPLEDA